MRNHWTWFAAALGIFTIANLAGCDQALPAPSIDLRQERWHVKAGFHPDDVTGFSEGEGLATRPPLYPERIFAAHPKASDGPLTHHYTVQIRFDVSDENWRASEAGAPWALRLGSIGQAWEAYLNGRQIGGEISTEADGSLAKRQRRVNYLLPIPADTIRAGQNILVFHLAGDPSPSPLTPNTAVGFFRDRPYQVAPYTNLAEESEDAARAALLSVFFFVGLFSLGIGLFKSTERAIATSFGLTALGLFTYLTARAPFVLNHVADTSFLFRLANSGIVLGAAAALIFIHTFAFEGRAFRAYEKLYLTSAVVLFFWLFATPFSHIFVGLRIWQLFTLGALGWIIIEVIGAAFRKETRSLSILPIAVVPALAVLWDIFNSVLEVSTLRLAEYGFVLLILGVGVLSMLAYLRTYRHSAGIQAMLAENKHRMESLNAAAIEPFCLREGNSILEANPAFLDLFEVTADRIAGTAFSRLFLPKHRERVLPALEADNMPIEAIAITESGKTFPAEFVSRTYDLGQRRVKVTAVRDTSTRIREAEHLLDQNAKLQTLTRLMVERELSMITVKEEIERLRRP